MTNLRMTASNKKLMFAGLMIAKNQDAALNEFGCTTLTELYKKFADIVGGNPRSLKLYRDEFDRMLPNSRAGFCKRKMTKAGKTYFELYGAFSYEALSEMVGLLFNLD